MNCNFKKIHRALGIVLLLPLLGWVFTGAVFLIKPGYSGAYEQLSTKFYPIDKSFHIDAASKAWTEIRLLKTILGYHLLVHEGGQWKHLNPDTLLPEPKPQKEQIIQLLTDALDGNAKRYGDVLASEGDSYITSTGVELTLNWQTLRISQKGQDTKVIDTLYRIHYLQWLGGKNANLAFGVSGLLALLVMVIYGAALYIQKCKTPNT